MALKNNTWKLNQWYDQSVAGNADYSGEIQLWALGNNQFGELGQNNATKYSSPVQIPGTTWSKDSFFPSTYGSTTFIIPKTDGTLWAWGDNEHGELGVNNRTQYSSPVQIGSDTDWSKGGTLSSGAWAIKTDGTLWCWGLNEKGQLGQNAGGDNAMRSSPVQVGSDTTWSKLSMVHKGLGSIKTDGTLWVLGGLGVGGWGLSLPDSFDGYSSPIQIPGTTWDTLSFSYRGHFATKTDATRWGWGNNDFGSLGLNNTAQYSSPVQIPGFDPNDWIDVQPIGSTGKSTIAIKQL